MPSLGQQAAPASFAARIEASAGDVFRFAVSEDSRHGGCLRARRGAFSLAWSQRRTVTRLSQCRSDDKPHAVDSKFSTEPSKPMKAGGGGIAKLAVAPRLRQGGRKWPTTKYSAPARTIVRTPAP